VSAVVRSFGLVHGRRRRAICSAREGEAVTRADKAKALSQGILLLLALVGVLAALSLASGDKLHDDPDPSMSMDGDGWLR
jgi:hypothetical protein